MMLTQDQAGGRQTLIKAIVVIPAPTADLLAQLAPELNPVPASSNELVLRWPPVAGVSFHAEAYNLAGERILTGSADGSVGRLGLGLGNASGGIYMVQVLATSPGQRPCRRVVKVAVVR